MPDDPQIIYWDANNFLSLSGIQASSLTPSESYWGAQDFLDGFASAGNLPPGGLSESQAFGAVLRGSIPSNCLAFLPLVSKPSFTALFSRRAFFEGIKSPYPACTVSVASYHIIDSGRSPTRR